MPAFLHLFRTSWNRRWILTEHPVAQEKHVPALIPPPPPALDSESIRMFRDGPLEKLLGGGWGIFDPHDFVFVIVFLVFFFFCAFAWVCLRVHWRAWIFFHSIFPLYFAPFAYFSTSPLPFPASTMTFLMVNGPSLKTPRSCTRAFVH